MTAHSLTVGYVPGGAPVKWARIWTQRHHDVRLELHAVDAAEAVDAVRDGTVDVALLRPTVDMAGLAAIPLYEETTVVVVPSVHLLTALDEVAAADIADEPLLVPLDDVVGWTAGVPVAHRPETTRDATELVAAGVGVLIVPQSLARLHHRKDLTYRPVVDAPTCPVVLAFPAGEQAELVEKFIGVVRGRKATSSRGQSEPAPKRTAREKTLSKQAARAVAKAARRPAERGRR
ncbi:LysR family substrate-binding domain-containing protein [Mycobacterium sp. C31M]